MGLVERLSVSASSIGRRPPSAPRPSTDRYQAPLESGGSSCTTSRERPAPVTGLTQRSSRLDTSRPAATGATNPEPSRRVMTASPTSAPVRTTGGGAGITTRPAASEAMASTTARTTSSTTALASARDMATTGPGIAPASSSTATWSTSAGIQRTWRSSVRPSGRRLLRRAGTMAPRATIRTAYTATRPSQVTLEPTPSPPRPPPTATSQPRASATGIERAAARSPAGSGTPRCWFHPTAGPPMPSRRSDRPSCDAGDRVGTGGPHHDLVGRPRRLQAHLAGGIGRHEHGVGGVGRPGQPVVGQLEALELGLEVGEDLVALGARQVAGGVEVVLGVVEHALEGAPPSGRVGFQQGELLVCRDAVDRRPGGRFHRSRGLIHRSIRRSSAPHPRRQGDPGECGPAQASRNTPGEGVPPRWAGLQTSSA